MKIAQAKSILQKLISNKIYFVKSIYFSSMKNTSKSPELDKFGRPYPPKAGKYYVPKVTTDAVVLRQTEENYDVLLITRGHDPFKGYLAFPGGFLEYNEEPEEGCLRELLEETNIKGQECKLLMVCGHPLRDPRGHTVSLIYIVKAAKDAEPLAGDDAATAKFYPLKEMLAKKDAFAFDHYNIILEAEKYISKNPNF